MKFYKVTLLDKEGNRGGPYWINIDKVVGVTEVPIPGQLAGPGGEAIAEMKCAVDVGKGMLLVDEKAEVLVEAFEKMGKILMGVDKAVD